MDRELFWRYWADFSALYPGAVLCFAPVLEFVRKPRRRYRWLPLCSQRLYLPMRRSAHGSD